MNPKVEASGAFGVLARTNLSQLWRRGIAFANRSPVLVFLIGIFVFGYWWLSFLLFQKALRFADAFPGLGTLLVDRMIYLLFAFLFALLLISNLLINYTNLFRNRETAHLLCLPLSPQTIYRWKFVESTVLASWAFLFLVGPLLLAFGMQQKAGWTFYGMTMVAMLLFIVLPAVAGSVGAILMARYLDRRLLRWIVASTALVGIALTMRMQSGELTEQMLETRVLVLLDRLLANTRFALFAFLPSYWLSSSVLQWAEGALWGAFFFLAVLMSYTLFFGTLAFTQIGQPFYEAFSTVQSRGSKAWRWFQNFKSKSSKSKSSESKFALSHRRQGFLERLFKLIFWIRSDTRSVLIKDTRMFWRDTAQWGQSLMLFALLGVYILNLRHFSSQWNNPFWSHLISYLNLGACSLNLATLTTRFVYPQFSLEGKRLWIVGMAPLGLEQWVRAKYWLGCCVSLCITVGLMTLSSTMLKMPVSRMAFFSAIIALMTLTLNGLAMGLGTLYPNFKEENPSKIVSGFGGTLCLVLSFLYIVFSVLILALNTSWHASANAFQPISWMALGLFFAVSILLGWLPTRLGKAYLKSLEI